MKAVKSKNTKIEVAVRRELWKRGVRYRTNSKTLFGKPDISIKKLKLVIFIDSCFWHGCPFHGRLPKSNIEFWTKKIQRNIERDKEVTEYYQKKNWHIVRVWEHELKENFQTTLQTIYEYILCLRKEN